MLWPSDIVCVCVCVSLSYVCESSRRVGSKILCYLMGKSFRMPRCRGREVDRAVMVHETLVGVRHDRVVDLVGCLDEHLRMVVVVVVDGLGVDLLRRHALRRRNAALRRRNAALGGRHGTLGRGRGWAPDGLWRAGTGRGWAVDVDPDVLRRVCHVAADLPRAQLHRGWAAGSSGLRRGSPRSMEADAHAAGTIDGNPFDFVDTVAIDVDGDVTALRHCVGICCVL